MASTTARDYVPKDRLIHRRIVLIPRDQNALLGRGDSAWAENLRVGKHGMLNVPSEVLEDLKDFHRRKNAQPSQIDPGPSQRKAPSVAEPPSSIVQNTPKISQRRGHPDRSSQAVDSRVEQEQTPTTTLDLDGEESDHDTDITWSQSQLPKPEPEPSQHRISPFKSQDPQTVPVSSPEGAPPSPPRLKRNHAATFRNEFPSSSAGEDEGLELEIPKALNQQVEPVNRAARAITSLPQPTPPSAQVQGQTIPFSYNQNSSIEQPPPPKRRHRMVTIDHSDKFKRSSLSRINPRRPPAFNNPTSWKSSTVPTPSFAKRSLSSVLDKTYASAQSYGQSSDLNGSGTSNSSQERINGHKVTLSSSITGGPPVPTARYRSIDLRTLVQGQIPRKDATSQDNRTPAPGQAQQKEVVTQDQPNMPMEENSQSQWEPYDKFRAAYPDYEGSARDFVSACLSIQDLRGRRAIASFIYDDFIRVFVTEYMPYIASLQDDGIHHSHAMSTIQWYNEHVPQMRYREGVVNKNNLDAVLQVHRDVAEEIKYNAAHLSASSKDSQSWDSQQPNTPSEPIETPEPVDEPELVDELELVGESELVDEPDLVDESESLGEPGLDDRSELLHLPELVDLPELADFSDLMDVLELVNEPELIDDMGQTEEHDPEVIEDPGQEMAETPEGDWADEPKEDVRKGSPEIHLLSPEVKSESKNVTANNSEDADQEMEVVTSSTKKSATKSIVSQNRSATTQRQYSNVPRTLPKKPGQLLQTKNMPPTATSRSSLASSAMGNGAPPSSSLLDRAYGPGKISLLSQGARQQRMKAIMQKRQLRKQGSGNPSSSAAAG